MPPSSRLAILLFAALLPVEAYSYLSYHWVAKGLSSYPLFSIRLEVEKLAPKIKSEEMFIRVLRTNLITLSRIKGAKIEVKGEVLYIDVEEYRPRYVHKGRLLTVTGEPCPATEGETTILEGTLARRGAVEWDKLDAILAVFKDVKRVKMKSGVRVTAQIFSGEAVFQVELSGSQVDPKFLDELRVLSRHPAAVGRLWILDYSPWSSYPVTREDIHGM